LYGDAVGSGFFQKKGGNVGIGTTSPGQKLEVVGGIKVSGNIAGESVANVGYLDHFSGTTRMFSQGPNATTRGNYSFEQRESDQGNGITWLSSNTSGDVSGTHGTYHTASDERLKTNIQPLTGVLGKLAQVDGVSYEWINPENEDKEGIKLGLIAQNVEKIFPEVIHTDDNEMQTKAIEYDQLSGIFVSAINEISAKIDLDKAPINKSSILINSEGNVGIGTENPNYDLEVAGDIAANSFVNISTRDSKKNISYLSETDTNNFLEKIKNLKIAKYDYKTDSGNSAQRLGLIAEEAPSEILTASGKGVDLYKLTTFALAGIQGLQMKLDDIETRLTNLESDRSQTSSGQIVVQNIGNIVTELFGGAKNFVFDKIKATALAAKDIITDKFLTKEFTIDKTKNGDTDPIVGEAVLKEGNSKIVVENNTIQEGDLVFVSILGERAVYWSISNIEVNKSFTVNFNEIQEEDIRFVYWIVHTEDNSSNDENQEAEDDQPLIIDDQPLIIDDQPLIIDDQPLIIDDQPLIIDDQPLTADDQSLITDQLTADDQPLIIDQLTADDQPLVIDSSEDSNISIDSSPEPGVESQTEVN